MLEVDRLRSSSDAAYRLLSNTTHVRWEATGLRPVVLRRRVENTFHRLCAAVSPTLGVEIGAHEASFSRRIQKNLPGTKSVAFEANPYVHERFRAELAAAGVDYRHAAAAAEAGDVELTIPLEVRGQQRPIDGTSGSLSLHKDAGDTTQVTVPAVRIDDAVSTGPDDTVVAWIDVEGANQPVLESAVGLLQRTVLVFIEVEDEEIWPGQWLDTDVAWFFAGLGMVPIFRDIQAPARHFQHNVVYAVPEVAEQRRTAEMINRLFRGDNN